MKSRTRLGAAALAALALLATACGDDDKSSSGTTATTVAIPAAEKDDAAAALVPAAIASKGTLVIALDATYPPSEFIAEDGKTIIGFDADLVTAIGQVLGLKVDLQNATFDTIIPGIGSGKYDIGASSFTDTQEREQVVDFVTYFNAGEGYYVAAGSTVNFDGLESLCGHSVSYQKGTTEEADATAQNDACKAAGKEGVTLLAFDSQTDANVAVSSGRAEVGFVDSPVAAYIAAESNGQFKVSGSPFSTAPYGFALAKDGLAPAVQAALQVLIDNGIYGQILAKWGVADGAVTAPVINGAVS